MKAKITLREIDITNKKQDFMPQQTTLDFLMNYSRALHVVKLSEEKSINLILN